MSDLSTYTIACDQHGPGQAMNYWDHVKQDKELHIANNPQCESAVEIRQLNHSGGYEVVEGADGTQLPDR